MDWRRAWLLNWPVSCTIWPSSMVKHCQSNKSSKPLNLKRAASGLFLPGRALKCGKMLYYNVKRQGQIIKKKSFIINGLTLLLPWDTSGAPSLHRFLLLSMSKDSSTWAPVVASSSRDILRVKASGNTTLNYNKSNISVKLFYSLCLTTLNSWFVIYCLDNSNNATLNQTILFFFLHWGLFMSHTRALLTLAEWQTFQKRI